MRWDEMNERSAIPVGSTLIYVFGLNIFYSSQDMKKDRAEQKAMFSPLHIYVFEKCFTTTVTQWKMQPLMFRDFTLYKSIEDI